MVYYLGGKIAEDGVNKEDNELIAEAKKLLKKNTGLKLKGAEWQSIKIDRAEPEQKRGRLPDESFVKNFDKTILCFPVKLALAPHGFDSLFSSQTSISTTDGFDCERDAKERKNKTSL